jgi:hypothetical protein
MFGVNCALCSLPAQSEVRRGSTCKTVVHSGYLGKKHILIHQPKKFHAQERNSPRDPMVLNSSKKRLSTQRAMKGSSNRGCFPKRISHVIISHRRPSVTVCLEPCVCRPLKDRYLFPANR